MFFSVNNCVEKYLKYISVNDVDKIYNLLNEEYRTNHNINKETLFEKSE